MSTTTETGHSKNIANFERIISFCTSYNTEYQPSNPNLAISVLNTLLNDSRLALSQHLNQVALTRVANNKRRAAFNAMRKLSTQVVNILQCTNATALTIQDAKNILYKIRGVKAKKPKTNTPASTDATTTEPSPTTPTKTISTTQLSYPQRIEHFEKLLTLVSFEPQYTPSEVELQIPALTIFLENLKTLQTAAINANTALSNSRINRNNYLYKGDLAILPITRSLKAYITGRYGTNHPKTQQVITIKIKQLA